MAQVLAPVARTMSSSTQRACVLEDVIAVTGGGIKDDVPWIIKPIIVEGKRFANILGDNYRCQQFLGKRFNMVKHIKTIRSKEVDAHMRALSKEEDPNMADVETDSTKPKRELIDRIPKILAIDVTTASTVATVNVLAEAREHGVLRIEVTKANLELLLEEPPAEATAWIPDVDETNIYWIPSREKLQCKYWDSAKMKYRYKTMQVEFVEQLSPIDKQDAVRNVALELQKFYDDHHSKENNMPEQEEDRGTDGDVSDASTAGEPRRKRMRTETEVGSPAMSERG